MKYYDTNFSCTQKYIGVSYFAAVQIFLCVWTFYTKSYHACSMIFHAKYLSLIVHMSCEKVPSFLYR